MWSLMSQEVDPEALCMVCELPPSAYNVEAIRVHLVETAPFPVSPAVSPPLRPAIPSPVPPMVYDASVVHRLALANAETQRAIAAPFRPPRNTPSPPHHGGGSSSRALLISADIPGEMLGPL